MTVSALVFLAGLALVTAGAGIVYLPAGFVVAGVGLMAAGWLSARGARAAG